MARSAEKNTAEGALREWIARSGGSVSFEEFMRWALYDEEHGYYSRRVRTVGRTGDFSTAATLGTALAEAVAAWAVKHRREVTARGKWHLIELGGGSGEMAAGVLGAVGWWARRGLRYELVEVSEGLRTAQGERLAAWGGRVRWHGTLAGALAAAGGRALIFSNEFVDAFPFARWEWTGAAGGWRELRVAWADGMDSPVETVGGEVAAADRMCASIVADGGQEGWKAGQRVEVSLAYRRWMTEQLAGWKGGRMLTVDYGEERGELYRRRPRGTLRAYCRQMRFEGAEVFERPGQQDLTADVNFTDLRRWGEEWGLATVDYGTEADFLRRWRRGGKEDQRTAAMMDPDGAGGAFKVLEQTRGLLAGRPVKPAKTYPSP